MSLSEEHEMIIDLVRKFVTSELLPLEPAVLAREADGKPWHLTPEENEHLMARTKELGLWGLDAPESTGGYNLPNTVMARINEELGTTAVPFTFPPDSPNLLMLEKHGTPEQKEKYLVPYIEGKTISAICICAISRGRCASTRCAPRPRRRGSSATRCPARSRGPRSLCCRSASTRPGPRRTISPTASSTTSSTPSPR